MLRHLVPMIDCHIHIALIGILSSGNVKLVRAWSMSIKYIADLYTHIATKQLQQYHITPKVKCAT